MAVIFRIGLYNVNKCSVILLSKVRTYHDNDNNCPADLEKVFKVPQILNLPFSNVPQKCVKTMENSTVHYAITRATIKYI